VTIVDNKTIGVLFIIAILVAWWEYSNHHRAPGVSLSSTFDRKSAGDQIEVDMGPYHYVYIKQGDVDVDLRVYGYNNVEQMFGGQDVGPYAVISHMFIAVPKDLNNQAYDKYLCERSAMDSASMFQVITPTTPLRKQVNSIARSKSGCANVKGAALTLSEYTFNGGESRTKWEIGGGQQFSFDPKKFLMLSDITEIPCR
jgi:hypothetical protein